MINFVLGLDIQNIHGCDQHWVKKEWPARKEM